MPTETYLTPGEAAQYLRTSTSTLAKRRLTGRGPDFVRIGRAIRYRQRDLDSWMAASVESYVHQARRSPTSTALRGDKPS